MLNTQNKNKHCIGLNCLTINSMGFLVPASQGKVRGLSPLFPRQAAAAAGVDGGSILSNTNTGWLRKEAEPRAVSYQPIPCLAWPFWRQFHPSGAKIKLGHFLH